MSGWHYWIIVALLFGIMLDIEIVGNGIIDAIRDRDD